MRKLIAGMKISVDGKMEGPEHGADWVEAWSEDYGLTPQVDACVLGGGMYAGYEQYWTAIQNEPDKPVWITGSAPTPAELKCARAPSLNRSVRQRQRVECAVNAECADYATVKDTRRKERKR